MSRLGVEGGGKQVKQPISIDYAFSGIVPDVVTTRTGTLVIPAGINPYRFTQPVALGDTLDEDDEQFTITFSNPRLVTTKAAFAGNDTVIVTIVDDDTTEVQIADVTVAEDADTAVFTVTLEPLNAFHMTIDYATDDGTATANQDYMSVNGSITILALTRTGTISVPIISNTLSPGTKSFTVTVSNPTRGILGNATATGTIITPDATPSFSVATALILSGTPTTPVATAEYTLTVTDTDGNTDASDTATLTFSITVNAPNNAPISNAGNDKSVAGGALVILEGSGTDTEGENLSYTWTQTSGATVTLSDTNTASPRFTAPSNLVADAVLVFSLTVTDERNAASLADTVIITVNAHNIAIRDSNFEQTLMDLGIDTNGKNGNILKSDAAKITSLNVRRKKISDLAGIQAFTSLTSLTCSGNQLTNLDVSKNTALTFLACSGNQLISLDVSKNTTLAELGCAYNQLTGLDVSKNTALTQFIGNGNQLMSLNVSKNTALMLLYCDYNNLTSLDVSNNSKLTTLVCASNKLTSLDVSTNTVLSKLFCASNQLESLNVSKSTALAHLDCSDNQLTSLEVSASTDLVYLNFNYNNLEELDVSNSSKLTSLRCKNNRLTSLNIANGNNSNFIFFKSINNPNLTCIQVDDVRISRANWRKDAVAIYSENCSSATNIAKSKQDKTIPDFDENEDFEKTCFLVSPNPAMDVLNITAAEKADYTLVNVRGQILKKGTLATRENKLDISSLARGVYFLNIKTSNGSFIEKIIKN